MNLAEIEATRQRILSGQYDAVRLLPLTPPKGRHKRKRVEPPKANAVVDDGDWYEEAFFDEFYGSDDDNGDVAPNYFGECELLVTSYAADSEMGDGVPSGALFKGSNYSAKDLARFLLAFKARNMKVCKRVHSYCK